MIPSSKNELITELKQSYSKLYQDLLKIPESLSRQMRLAGNIKGTHISVSDSVSYLIGWGELVLKWHDKKSKNLPVDFPETGFKWNELGKLAQKFHSDFNAESYQHLLLKLDQTYRAILDLVELCEDDNLYGSEWYKSYTLGRMIQLNTVSPYKSSRIKIRRFIKQNKIG